METYEILFKTVCRVCLKYGNKSNMVCLIDNTSDDGLSSFGKAVVTFTKISITVTDNLPNSMCDNCLKLLKHAIYFKLKCESSDKQLLSLLKLHENKGINLKESILDYLMFKQYFPQESPSKPSNEECKRKPESCHEDFDNNLANDFENTCLEIDNNDNQTNSDKDSADEELDILEKMVEQSCTTSSYKPPVKLKLLKQKQLKEKTLPSQYKSQRRKMLVKRTDKENYVCKICQKVLANQHTYKYHMERHTGCKFICEHCGKGFPVLVELNMHLVARHGTGLFLQCPHCPYKAPRKLTLVEHIRIHTGERPYTCDKCGLTFRRSAIWKKHMVYHTEKTVQCPQCPRKFFRRSEMQAHANNIHERMYVYLCHKCDATYAKTATVRRHLLERHGIPREMQGKILRVNKARGTEFPEQ